MPICEVIGFGLSLGGINLFPKAGPEIPTQDNHGSPTSVELFRQIDPESREIYGITAVMVDPNTLDLYTSWNEVRGSLAFSHLVREDINRHSLTRGRLRWVENTTPGN